MYNWCTHPEDEPKRVKTCWSCNILNAKNIYNNIVHFVAVV